MSIDHYHGAAPGNNEELFRNAVEQSIDGILLTDAEMVISEWNLALEHLFGYSRREMIGKHLAEFQLLCVAPERRNSELLETFKNALADLRTMNGRKWLDAPQEISIVNKRNESRTVLVSMFPIIGAVTCFGSIIRDISDRKLAEQALRASKERYRTIVENMNDALYVHDFKGLISECNDNACRMLGYDRNELIGLNLRDLDAPVSAAQVSDNIGNIRANGSVVFDSAQLRKDGSCVYVNVSARMVSPKNGGMIQAFVRDISERKQAEHAVISAKEEWEKTFNAMSDLIMIVDKAFRIVKMNSAMKKRSAVEIGALCHEVVHGLNCPHESCPHRELLADGREHTAECLELRLDGYFLVNVSPLFDEHGVVTGSVHVMRDITERKKNEDSQLKREKIESLGHLAAGVAHDFNNLLGGIFGYMDMAKEKLEQGKTERAAEFLEKSLKIFNKAKGLTSQFVTFAKGGAPVKTRGDLAATLRNNVSFALSGSNVRADYSFAPDLWPCDYDEHQFGQVVDNLTINAKQAMDTGGTLSISAENIELQAPLPDNELRTGRFVKLTFSDTGPGVPPELHKRIFDPFFTTKKRGSGLGLATALSIVNKHGGHLSLAPAKGKGAVFIIWLPALTTAAPAPVQEATGPEAASGTIAMQGRILLMDDEESMLDMGVNILTKRGCTVSVARNGETALALFKQAREEMKPFSAVVLDLTIVGGMGGMETAKQLLALDPAARLVVSSGYSDDPIMAHPADFGFVACVPKPYKKEELANVIAQVLAQRS